MTEVPSTGSTPTGVSPNGATTSQELRSSPPPPQQGRLASHVSVQESTDDEVRPAPPPLTIARDIKTGLLGLGIAVLCLLPPGIHFVSGPLGPAIGGFFASARIHARGKHLVVLGVTMGIGMALVAWVVAGVLLALGVVKPDASSAIFAFGVDVLIFVYATSLACIGAYIGGRGESA